MRRSFFFHKSNSGEIARSRLKLLLVSDQAGCSPVLIEGIREDMMEVFSRYAELDAKELRVTLTRTDTAAADEAVPALLARVPIRRFTKTRKN